MPPLFECAHCGARIDHETTRCPQCLRTTALVRITDTTKTSPKEASRNRWVLIVLSVIVLSGAVVALLFMNSKRNSHSQNVVQFSVASSIASPPPLQVAPSLDGVVAQVRSAIAGARARTTLDIFQREKHPDSVLVRDEHQVPPSRTIAEIFQAIKSPLGRYTSLDAARLMAALIRASGTDAKVAERTLPPRADEANDPSGLLGVYVVVVDSVVIDTVTLSIVRTTDTRPVVLDDTNLTAAVLCQSIVAFVPNATSAAARQQIISASDQVVQHWTTSSVPLATRAYASITLGLGAFASIATRDMESAVAIRPEAGTELRSARIHVLAGDVSGAISLANSAFTRAPAWGETALMKVVVSSNDNQTSDASDRCSPLDRARDSWALDAATVCRGGVLPPEGLQRLSRNSPTPLRVAFAMSAGLSREQALSVLSFSELPELPLWLRVLRRDDLARSVIEALSPPDAGH